MRLVAIIAFTVIAGDAFAQLSTAVMMKGNGIGEILYKSKPCEFSINQPKLEAYLTKNGMDNPEALNWITMAMDAAELNGTPSVSECTMARVTAKKMGILN